MKLQLLLLAGLGLLILPPQADARGRSGSFTGGGGRTFQRDIVGQRTGTGFNRQTVTTAPKGRSLTGQQTATRNSDGTATVNGSYATSGGKSATTSRLVSPTTDGRTSAGTVTTGQGQTATTNGSVTREDGTRTATRSITGPNGETKSATNTATRK